MRDPLGIASLGTLGYDGTILFLTRIIRLFAFGATSVCLAVFLHTLGLTDPQIGSLLSLTLFGDAAISLAVTSHADRIGRRVLLVFGCFLMGLCGVIFASASGPWYWALLFAATIGVLSPFGNEVGPFMALEQSVLTELVPTSARTSLFAWYNVAAYFSTALGSMTTGAIVTRLSKATIIEMVSYRFVFVGYSAAALVMAVLFMCLTKKVEAHGHHTPVPSSAALPAPGAPTGGAETLTRPLLEAEGEAGEPDRAGDPEAAAAAEQEQAEPVDHVFLGIRGSTWPLVIRLGSLFALDSFGGGLINGTLLVYYFRTEFGSAAQTLGLILFVANVLSGLSSLVAARLGNYFGLVNTMVFTHLPSNVLLAAVGLARNERLAIILVFLRFCISQMDVAPRQSYIAGVVPPDQKTAIIGFTNIVRSVGAAFGPLITGQLAHRGQYWVCFVLAGGIKIVYDLLLLWGFRHQKADVDHLRERRVA